MRSIQGWHDLCTAGCTTRSGARHERKTFPLVESAADVMLTTRDMLDAVGDDAIVKLDVRDVDEWVGTSSSPYGVDFCPRKGRIPGAVWLE